MGKKRQNDNPNPLKTLRGRAEERLRESPADIGGKATEDQQRLVQELRLHQIELEMQNDELRRALNELEEARNRYIDLYDFAPVGYLTLDKNGDILEANLTAAAMLGLSKQQLIGRRLALSVARSDRDTLHRHFQELSATNERQSCRLDLNTSEDSPTTVQLESIVHIEANEVRFRTTLSDVTRTRRLEDALNETTKQLRWTDALPILVCYLDSDLRYQYANATHVEWFGIQPATLRGQRLKDSVPKDYYRNVEGYLVQALAGRDVVFEMSANHPKGGGREVQGLFVPDISPDGTVMGLHGLFLDISARKLIEKQAARRRMFEQRLTRLTTDEREVYALLVQGLANKTIAYELDIGLRTAERRRQIILQKLDVASLAELLQALADIQAIEGASDSHKNIKL